MGINPAEVLKLAGLPADLFARREANLSTSDYFGLWKGLEETAKGMELPLKIAQVLSVEAFEPLIFTSLFVR